MGVNCIPASKEYKRRAAHYNAYQKAWYKRNKAKTQAAVRLHSQALRKEVIAKYGNKCACCGETAYEFLAIDHIHGGGCKERREKKFPNSQTFFRYLSKNYEPTVYRVLCHNCNSARGYYGYCPHEQI